MSGYKASTITGIAHELRLNAAFLETIRPGFSVHTPQAVKDIHMAELRKSATAYREAARILDAHALGNPS